MRFIGVHGIWNHVAGGDPEQVAATKSSQWQEYMARGLGCPLDAADVRVAYWAPILHRGIPVHQSSGEDGNAALDLLEAQNLAAAELAWQWLETQDLPQSVAQGRLGVPLRHAVDFIVRRSGGDGRLTKLFIAAFFKEVALYLTGPQELREAVREHVADVIADSASSRDEGGVAVLAHSLGSVIAYEALHARPDLQVDLLITMGSPLGIPHAVFHRLQPSLSDRPLDGKPPSVRRWINVSDHGDFIAVPRPLSATFPGIDLDLNDSIGLFNFHLVGGYLASPAVAASVHPFVAQ